MACDVTRRADSEALVAHAVERLDLLDVDGWDRTIDTNIKGVLYAIAAALPRMKAQKSGHIISISSVAGHRINGGAAVYAATKHAVRVIAESLRQEVTRDGIRSTIVSPGATETELFDTITDPTTRDRLVPAAAMALPADSVRAPSPMRSTNPTMSTSTRS